VRMTMKINNLLLTLFCLAGASLSWAQTTARVNITSSEGLQQRVSLTAERVHFHETLGVGLADTQFENLGVVDLSTNPTDAFIVKLDKPMLVRLTTTPTSGATGAARIQLLYLRPGDQLTVKLLADQVDFTGSSAPYQQFLRDYYRENHYQYLPAFSYKPTQVDNQAILRQSDSLQQLRRTRYSELSGKNKVDKEFDAYVNALSMTEPYLLQALVMDRDFRKNRPVKLDAGQQKKVTELTLKNFKVQPDEALLSQTYRNELRTWILLSANEPAAAAGEAAGVLTPQGLEKVYRLSGEKLANYPRQREYLQTYWLNHASTAYPTTQTARTLLTDYRTKYPQSAHVGYFEQLLGSREQLTAGTMAPDVALLGVDSSVVSLSKLRGNPMVLVTAFNLKQHEPSLRALEDQYKDKVNFVYVSVAPGVPFSTWKQYTEARPGVMHVWASEQAVEELKKKYAISTRFPFVVLDAQGRIVNRWVPLDFPESKALKTELDKIAGR
jgi:hypothetical protein